MRTLVLACLIAAATFTGAWEAKAVELLQPDPAFSAKKVVSIQLNALKSNDTPEEDAGIAQTGAFAHPDNRRTTGPLPRFRRMIKGPLYRMLLNHRAYEIEEVSQSARQAVFAVTVTASDGQAYGFRWRVQKIIEGEHAGAWATIAVSPPMHAGDAT